MSMSKTTNTYNRQNWEDADFPILCQTCLGDNPYIRMTKEKYGKECKICTRPFTVFRWCPGAKMRFKKSEVCQTCSRQKNVCQTCLLDLEYGLPTQVRDIALNLADDLPRSDVNKEYHIQNIEREMANTGDASLAVGVLGKTAPASKSEVLTRLARSSPYYKRNRPHICSFWVKGECRRGEECPYRHDKPTDPDDPLADQNIKDRYYGLNDPVADKLLKRAAAMPKLEPPEDKSITTLYVGNLGEDMTEGDLHKHFYQFGEVRNINLVAKQQYAFVQYTSRGAAELAAERTFNKLVLNGKRINIKWGRSQPRQGGGDDEDDHSGRGLAPVPGIQSLPPPPKELSNDYFNLDPQANSIPLPPGHGPSTSGHPGVPMAPPPLGMFPPRFPPGPPPPFFPANFRPQIRHSSYYPQPPPIPGVGPPSMATGQIHYPSQDPSQMGATPSDK